MKIRRSITVLLVMIVLILPVSLYRTLFSGDAADEMVNAVNIIFKVLMGIFLLLTFSFSIFTDDFPHSYNESKNPVMGIISVLLAAALGYTSALGFISEDLAVYTGIPGKAFGVLGVLSVLAFMFYAVSYFKGENIITAAALVPIFPAFWYGFRLLCSFLESASMADISSQLVLITVSCAFTIFSLTLGKLFSCSNSYSVKWTFVSGCVGTLCTLMYVADNLPKIVDDPRQLMTQPFIIVDFCMAVFAVGSMLHISVPAKFFDDEEWDDYFYETYDLPKPSLVLNTPVDELQEDVYTGDELDETPYIPTSAKINPNPSGSSYMQQSDVPSYIANPANYNSAMNVPVYPVYPAVQQPAYYPTYPAYQPVYPAYQPVQIAHPTVSYPPSYRPTVHPMPNAAPTDPYDAAALQYQYERRRAELQSRELEQLTGQVDASLSSLDSSVKGMQPPVNQYVSAAPDETARGQSVVVPSQALHPASGFMQPGERLTDHLDRINRESQIDASEPEDEYTYEYYYPNGTPASNASNRFNPYRPSNR